MSVLNSKKFFTVVSIIIISGIWGYLFPGSYTMNISLDKFGDINYLPFLLVLLLSIALAILLIGKLKDWTIHFGSYVTVRSREILIFGSFILIISAFIFNGFDIGTFFAYYYEMILITAYTLVSTTYAVVALMILLGIFFLGLGYILYRKKSADELEFSIRGWTFYTMDYSNYIIGGIISFVMGYLVFTLFQPNYVSESRGIFATIEGLPLPGTLVTALLDFYVDQVVYSYPLIIFICGLLMLKWSLNIPAQRMTSSNLREFIEEKAPIVRHYSFRFSLIMTIITLLIFVSIAITWIANIDGSIMNIQTLLFANASGILGFSIILIAIQYLPRSIGPFLDSRIIRYAARRVIAMVPMFIGISIISYVLMASTGNPVDLIISRIPQGRNREVVRENLMRIYGFNSPIQSQWFNWFFHFIMGDLGDSIITGVYVADAISMRIVPTLELSIMPLIFALAISIPIGIYAALKQYSWQDNSIAFFVSFALAIPIFLLILLMVIFFSLIIPIFPPAGRAMSESTAPGVDLLYVHLSLETFIQDIISWQTWDGAFHMVIPIIAITAVSLALYTRLIRSGYLEVVQQDYILSAQAYGFDERTIIFRHALRNVLIPIVTFLGLSIGGLLGGAPLTETTLSWPGLGAYGVLAILSYDYPVVMGLIMITALLILFANLFADLLYSVIDPRVAI
jgi:peptide/nickel transport system permease protein